MVKTLRAQPQQVINGLNKKNGGFAPVQTDNEPCVFAQGSFFIATEGRDRDIFLSQAARIFRPFYSLSTAGFRGLLPLKTRKEAPSSSYSVRWLQADTASVPYSVHGTAHSGDHDAVSHPRSSDPPFPCVAHTPFFSISTFAFSFASSHTCRIIVFSCLLFFVQFSLNGQRLQMFLSER